MSSTQALSSSASAAPTSIGGLLSGGAGEGQAGQGISIGSFISALGASFAVFGIELCIFLLISGRLQRIYLPRTFLVPERERTTAPPKGFINWIAAVFKTSNAEFIQKCGLDAYFFIRYLFTLLKVFIPLALVILPILLPINIVGGRGSNFAAGPYNTNTWTNVTGLDTLSWGNINPNHNNRYWAHLILAVAVVVYVCWVFFDELRDYIRVRQAYLTSPQHRLRASATTVLVSSIPAKWCTVEALDGLYDVFPGGIRNIWINRNFDDLRDKIKQRDKLAKALESAETTLIKKAKEVADKKKHKASKKDKRKSKEQLAEVLQEEDRAALAMAQTDGMSAGNPGQIEALEEILGGNEPDSSREPSPESKKPLGNIPVLGQGIDAVGQGLGKIGNLGKSVFRRGTGGVDGAQDSQENMAPNGDSRKRKDSQLEKVESKGASRKQSYPGAVDEGYDPNGDSPKWKEYLKDKDRETMRLPIFGWQWMISLPLIGKKVDTINYCRKELARLNLEIEDDQRHPDRYPLMNSAFVQFNHQVAAHMACQTVSHHTPNMMAPRVVEISPDDVIWDNMSIKWWESYVRTGLVLVTIAALIVGWAIPVTFTGALSHISYLERISWLTWIGKIPTAVLSIIQGILPPVLLALLLFLLPIILRFLAKTQGDLTGMSVELSVQQYYFTFLFVQLFLIVSISSGITTIIPQLAKSPQSTPSLLAANLPKASNYFFSYMLLQAFSVSGGALVQIMSLVSWYVLAPILDTTARQKWRRQVKLPNMQWGTFFPVYTNLACIGLIYCIISPLMMVFNIITFSLFWFVYRYNTLYVTKFNFDTGGLLFPTAINQLFTGLYFMELCLVGLFFLVRNSHLVDGEEKAIGTPCKIQAIIMIVVMFLTGIYQWLLNNSFGPLLRYLPITLEDEAVMRDEEFARAQEKRWALEEEEEQAQTEGPQFRDTRAQERERLTDTPKQPRTNTEDYELQDIEGSSSRKPSDVADTTALSPPTNPKHAWARRSREEPSSRRPQFLSSAADAAGTAAGAITRLPRSALPRRRRHPHHKPTHDDPLSHLISDLESQKMSASDHMAEALFSGINDEIEDLTPDERDKLIRRAFQHEALRARRPVIWIPRDEMGVSDDEVKRTARYTRFVWISNAGTGIDGKGRVVYRRSPPDFSEIDLIEL